MFRLLAAIALLFSFALPALAAVDLNSATLAQLETIKGIGPKKAQSIIDYRQKNGAFKSVDDLDKVKGFGSKSVNALRSELTVGNAKSAAPAKNSELQVVKGGATETGAKSKK